MSTERVEKQGAVGHWAWKPAAERVAEIRGDKYSNRPCSCPAHTAVRDLLAYIDSIEEIT